MTVGIAPQRAKPRWLVLMVICTALAALTTTAVVATAPETAGFVELDKDLHNDLTVRHLGSLNAQLLANANSVAICELETAPTDAILLIDGEYMKVTGRTQENSVPNNCAFSDPALTAASYATYTVLRAQAAPAGFPVGTAAGKHPGGSDVTRVIYPDSKTGIDWDDVRTAVQANGSAANPCSALLSGAIKACDWLDDPKGLSTLTQGSSDNSDLTGWTWTNSSVPDADEILHAYAAKAQGATAGAHQFLYFGADRFAVNGAKDMGFWFFKNPVNADPATGKFVDDEGNPAVHAVGDILLLGTFTQGGAVTTIRVFKWVGANGSDGSLDFGGAFGDCVPGGSSDGCNTVNNTTIPSPWAYVGKAAVAPNVIYGGGMMEGGIDLSALNLEGCFSSFMAETRSSPSLTAALKDFALGNFEACGATVVTTPKAGDGTTTVPAAGLQLGTGATGVTARDSAVLTISGTTSFIGTLKFFICGPIANSATCATGGVPAGTISNVTANGTYTSDVVKLTQAANNTTGAPGRYCWRAEFSSTTPGLTRGASDASAGECFYVKPVTPTLSTTSVDCTTTHAALSTVDFPGPFCDKAVLGGTANKPATNGGFGGTYTSILTGDPLPASNGAAATGTITFTLVGPDGTAQVACPSQTTVATGTNPQTATVSGNGDYFTSSVTVSSPGVYHWKASYDGDNPNTLGTSHNDSCDVGAETITVNQIPTVTTTRQFVFPQDKVKIDSTPTGATLSGSVTFRLFEATGSGATAKTALQNCQADDGTATATGLVYSEGPLSVSGTAPQTKTTDNETYRITDGRTYVWGVTYTSSTGAQLGSESDCTETTTVTFAGNDSGITIP